jgi:hypothetical protein
MSDATSPSTPKDPKRPSAKPWTPPPTDERFLEARQAVPADLPFTTEELLLVVVGAHLRSEIADRPLGERLVRLIRDWQATVLEAGDTALLPVVCTDVWFLNDRALMQQPCIAIGEPGHNAATAYYAARLPKVYVIEDVCAVQFDPENLDGSVCIWGNDARGTEAGFEAFVARHLDRYLRAIHFV